MAPGVKMRATALLLLSQATALWHCPCGKRAAAAAKAALTDRGLHLRCDAGGT